MATKYNIRYKNHCTPQEQILSGGRYYLDSDCGMKLTGNAEIIPSALPSYSSSTSITDTSASIADNKDFFFIKNTGANDVFISLNGTSGQHYISLSEGEAFSLELRGSSLDETNVCAKTASGLTSTIEYLTGVV